MKQDILHRILSEHKELSSLPQVVSEIIKISRDPDSSTSDISKVIMKDPNLTVRLLRVANSPFYSPVQEITTVNQAVITLGTRAVTALALAASVYNMINGLKSTVDRKRFWRHSLEVALASQEIARAVKYNTPEEAFVCGLLHDIGILILEASFSEDYVKIWQMAEAGENLVKMEEDNWGTNHARVGQFLLRQWGLPEILSEAVGGHHLNYGPEDNHRHQRVILMVNLANRISRFKIGNVPPAEAVEVQNKKTFMTALGLQSSIMAEIERNLINDVVNESAFLEIEVGSTEEILKEANRLLYDQYLVVENLLQEKQLTYKEKSTDGSRLSPDEKLTQEALVLLGQYLNDVTNSINKRTLILKSAVNKGDVKDKKGIATISAEAISEETGAVASIVAELKKFKEADDNYQYRLSDLKKIIDSRMKQPERQKTVELVQ